MRCPSTARERWRVDAIAAVQANCATIRTSRVMTSILSQGISRWLTDASDLPTDAFPQRFHCHIRQQNQIGWRQLFHGRLVNEWSQLHDEHTYKATHSNKQNIYYSTGTYKRTGDQWCQDMITLLWAQWTMV